LSDGPIEFQIDQQKGSFVVKSKNFEYRTDKLKKDEEYRLVIWLYRLDAILEMEMI